MQTLLMALLATAAAGQAADPQLDAAERIVQQQHFDQHAYMGYYRWLKSGSGWHAPPYSLRAPGPLVPGASLGYGPGPAGPPALPTRLANPPVRLTSPSATGAQADSAGPGLDAAEQQRLRLLLSQTGGLPAESTERATPPANAVEPLEANTLDPESAEVAPPAAQSGDVPAAEPLTPRQQAVLGQALDNLQRAEAFRDQLRGEVIRKQYDRQAQIEALNRGALFWNSPGSVEYPPFQFSPYQWTPYQHFPAGSWGYPPAGLGYSGYYPGPYAW